jgi:hypothetical protein
MIPQSTLDVPVRQPHELLFDPPVLYGIRCQQSGAVKFGVTKHPVRNRLRAIQMGCPTELVMVAYSPGDYQVEQCIHAALFESGSWLRGEWFADTADTAEVLYALATVLKHTDGLMSTDAGREASILLSNFILARSGGAA